MIRFMWKSAFFIDFLEKCYFEMVNITSGRNDENSTSMNSDLQVLRTDF